MKVDSTAFSRYLARVSFKDHGDSYEQQFGSFTIKDFPNCQKYWQTFVVPITKRIEGYPNSLSPDIHFRQSIDAQLQDISNIHYSAFLNFVYAHVHLEVKMLSSLEDFYVHLGSACDLIEAFFEKWYLLLLKCRGESTKILQSLSRDEFLKLAGDWYDKRYAALFEYYISKGKSPVLRLPTRENMFKECMEQYFRQAVIWKEYEDHSRVIREFRNVVVHDVQVGRLIVNGTEIFIPKPTVIQNYRTWREVAAASNDINQITHDFSPLSQQLKSDLEKLESIANRLWETVLKELEVEFYSPERNGLREMYQIEF